MIKSKDYIMIAKRFANQEYSKCDSRGIYFAHQPIYGFRKDERRNGIICNYIRTYQLIKLLSNFKGDSLLDVGGGEGYKANLAKKLLKFKKIVNTDISHEACKRAKEIFNLQSKTADAQNLPFEDNEFDVVISSETIEHVQDYHRAVDEMLRVTKKTVIITVPHEPKHVIEKSIKYGVPGEHVHCFNTSSFNYLNERGFSVFAKKILSPILSIPNTLVDASPREYNDFYKRAGYPKILVDTYNALVPIFRKLFDEKIAVKLIKTDEVLCNTFPLYKGIVFVIQKNNQMFKEVNIKYPSVEEILQVTVPFYYLKENNK